MSFRIKVFVQVHGQDTGVSLDVLGVNLEANLF